jgi:hypothetical protein
MAAKDTPNGGSQIRIAGAVAGIGSGLTKAGLYTSIFYVKHLILFRDF